MLRQEIIQQLSDSVPPSLYSPVEDLYSCFKFKSEPAYERIKIQTWLQGCIESLFYRPNKYCLILVCEKGYSDFFSLLSPNKNWVLHTTSIRQAQEKSHDFLFVCAVGELAYYSNVKQMRSMCMSQEFVVIQEEEVIDCDKRLGSYCATEQEWKHPVAKSDLVIEIEDFDWKTFSVIDKNLLWSELFHKFKLR